MSEKYHISPSTGNPNRCYASVKPCPLGGEADHFPTKEAAREAYEKRMASFQDAGTPSVRKRMSKPKLTSQDHQDVEQGWKNYQREGVHTAEDEVVYRRSAEAVVLASRKAASTLGEKTSVSFNGRHWQVNDPDSCASFRLVPHSLSGKASVSVIMKDASTAQPQKEHSYSFREGHMTPESLATFMKGTASARDEAAWRNRGNSFAGVPKDPIPFEKPEGRKYLGGFSKRPLSSEMSAALTSAPRGALLTLDDGRVYEKGSPGASTSWTYREGPEVDSMRLERGRSYDVNYIAATSQCHEGIITRGTAR